MLNSEDKPKVFTKEQAMVKAESYCAYQERSQQEMRDKLYDWGLHQADVEQIISSLIENNFLNEERFALAYTLGKFRMKAWGKYKIKQGLKFKRVPDKMISKSLAKIDEDDYREKLEVELKELRDSELWQAGKTVRSLRPENQTAPASKDLQANPEALQTAEK